MVYETVKKSIRHEMAGTARYSNSFVKILCIVMLLAVFDARLSSPFLLFLVCPDNMKMKDSAIVVAAVKYSTWAGFTHLAIDSADDALGLCGRG